MSCAEGALASTIAWDIGEIRQLICQQVDYSDLRSFSLINRACWTIAIREMWRGDVYNSYSSNRPLLPALLRLHQAGSRFTDLYMSSIRHLTILLDLEIVVPEAWSSISWANLSPTSMCLVSACPQDIVYASIASSLKAVHVEGISAQRSAWLLQQIEQTPACHLLGLSCISSSTHRRLQRYPRLLENL